MMIFDDPKVGDVVAVSSNGILYRAVIERVTKTTIVTNHGIAMRNTGNLRGAGTWRIAYAEPWTDEHNERMKKQKAKQCRVNLSNFLYRFQWRDLDSEQLGQIVALVKSLVEQEGKG